MMRSGADDSADAPGGVVDWSAAKRVFAEALDLPTAERTAFVRAELSGDLQTARRVGALLEAHEHTSIFLVEPQKSEVESRSLPDRIGAYRPIERLGEGGFGVVYRAEQVEPIARDVAIKILRPGLDTPEMLARFRDERQYLAQLDHGDIVKVFDAGVTDDGHAFLVMEYVEGESVTLFAARRTLTDRVKLIARICRAVHAVHQRGVIHRDLKPSNILVRGEGDDVEPRVRIIDFGIAAAAERGGHDSMTVVGAPLGTPRYASPEQIRGDAGIDTRTDVFALGMILCEVLTGTLPKRRDPSESLSLDRPSVLRPEEKTTLRGDLDRIVLKALAHRPDERYDSAAALAEDLERYLRNEPILATRASLLYTARKFVARRRATAAVLAVSAIAFVGGLSSLVVGTGQARAAERDVREALSRVTIERDRADSLNSFLLGDVIQALNPSATGAPVPRGDELLATMSELGEAAFADDPGTAYELFACVGDAQRSLSLHVDSATSHSRAVEAATRAFGPHDAKTLNARIDAVLSRLSSRDFDGVQDDLVNIVRLADEHLGRQHAVALRARMHAFHVVPDFVAGEDVATMPDRIARAGLAGSDVHIESLAFVGDLLGHAGDARGMEMLLEGLALAVESGGPTSSSTLDLINRLGGAVRLAGGAVDVTAMLEDAHRDAVRVYGPGRQMTRALLNQLALSLLLGGRADEGLERAKELHAGSAFGENVNANYASVGAMLVARAYEELGRHAEAVPWRRERLDRMLAASTDVRDHHAPRGRLVMTLVRAGLVEEAEAEFDAMRRAGGPHEQFRLSAALMVARAVNGLGRKADAAEIIRVERDSDAYPDEDLALLDRWLAALE